MLKPDPIPERCVIETSVTKIKVEANARRAVFDNADRATVQIIDVDCWISGSEELKADCIVVKPQVVDIVVELKGSDIRHAIRQIIATSQRWRSASGNSDMIGGLIVFTHSPESSASLANKKRALLSKNRIYLEVGKNRKAEYRFVTFTGKKV